MYNDSESYEPNDDPKLSFAAKMQSWLNKTRTVDFLAPLALRLYLFPVMWMAGTTKLKGFSDTVEWFGNPDWGLGLPFPTLMTALVVATETLGSISLLLGFALRWMCIPLMITMIVAALQVHWINGWLAIATGSGIFATERTVNALKRLEKAKEILQEHGDYGWLTEYGNFAVLNNGIEFAATYWIMLLVLFFGGAGRFVSLDYWIARRIQG
ncbi:MAG: HvfX family Cu-binding RiPP maturation protein [Methylococcales bacterium]